MNERDRHCRCCISSLVRTVSRARGRGKHFTYGCTIVSNAGFNRLSNTLTQTTHKCHVLNARGPSQRGLHFATLCLARQTECPSKSKSVNSDVDRWQTERSILLSGLSVWHASSVLIANHAVSCHTCADIWCILLINSTVPFKLTCLFNFKSLKDIHSFVGCT